MIIRKCNKKDLPICAVLKVFADGSEHSEKIKKLNLKYLKRYMKNDFSSIIVAEESKQIWGYAVISYDEWNNSMHIDSIYVRPDKQKRGIGSKILDSIINYSRKKNVRIIFLETGKKDNNVLHFYKKNGFKISGHIREMYAGINKDAIVMSLKL